jgi:thiol reductant ABC exporter CydC subunit
MTRHRGVGRVRELPEPSSPKEIRRPLLEVAALARPGHPRLALAVLAGAAATGCGIALLATSGLLISRAALQPPVLELMVAIVAVRAFGLGRGIARYLERLATHDVALRLLTELRAGFFSRLEPLVPGAVGPHRRGDLLARAVGDAESLQHLVVRGVVPPLVAVAVAVPAVAVTWLLLPGAGLVLGLGLVVAGVALPWAAAVGGRRSGRRQAALRGELAERVVGALEAGPELAATGRLDERMEGVGATDRALATHLSRDGAVAAAVTGASTLAAGAALLGTLTLAVAATGTGTLARVLLATTVLLVLAAFEAVSPLPLAAQHTESLRAAARRVLSLTSIEPPVRDPATPLVVGDGPVSVVLEGARVRYSVHQPWAIDGVDLDLRPGARIALVGASGSGKSTVAALLVRFRDPDGGRMTINGVDSRLLAQDEVRRVVSLAAQDAHLFDTTVEENVRMAQPDATDHEIQAALVTARLWDWVQSLPDGLATAVGERGARMSGGQRQRLSLARVLLKGAPVVVLDEPTANLDGPTARALVKEALDALADRTVLLITHRLRDLEGFDEIVVLDGGRVAERGRHGELMAAGGLYRRMVDLESDTDVGAPDRWLGETGPAFAPSPLASPALVT